MKILFFVPPPLDGNPPAERVFGCNYGIYAQPNIFFLYPATVLTQAGYSVTYMDFPVDGKGRADLNALASTQDFSLVVFYTVLLSRTTDQMARSILREGNPGLRFIFLGPEPTAAPDTFVDGTSIVIRGESENTIVQVVAKLGRGELAEGIPGVSYLREGRIIHESGAQVLDNLDSLPFPDRSLLEQGTYCNPKLSAQPFTAMIASRGCSFRCYYCVPNSQSFAREIEYKREHSGGKPPVRQRSAENVVEEVQALVEAGYRAVSFLDDQFVWGHQRTLAICDGIAPLGIEWSCLARPDMLQDVELVHAMGKAGCRYIDMGIESFSQEILDYIGKDLDLNTIYTAVRYLREAGIEPELNILLGSCPLETVETIEATFYEILRLDVDYVLFSICTPFPHTRFHDQAKLEGWMIRPEYEPIDPIKESFISYPHLTKKQLDRIIRRLYRRFYFRPSYIYRRLRRVQSLQDLWNKTRTALTILR